MSRQAVRAVCESCSRRGNCADAAALDQLRKFLENSRLAKEFALSGRRHYRLGCDRYRPERPRTPSRPPLRLIVANDRDAPCA